MHILSIITIGSRLEALGDVISSQFVNPIEGYQLPNLESASSSSFRENCKQHNLWWWLRRTTTELSSFAFWQHLTSKSSDQSSNQERSLTSSSSGLVAASSTADSDDDRSSPRRRWHAYCDSAWQTGWLSSSWSIRSIAISAASVVANKEHNECTVVLLTVHSPRKQEVQQSVGTTEMCPTHLEYCHRHSVHEQGHHRNGDQAARRPHTMR